MLGLVGSNGTGKTTALKIIAGNVKPNFGSFEVREQWCCSGAHTSNRILLVGKKFLRILEGLKSRSISPACWKIRSLFPTSLNTLVCSVE